MLRPTTKAQISGHKFLQRRVEHGIVMGDIRMIHDPLGRRKRGVIFGVGACVLGAVAAGAAALFAPAPDPGNAAILQAETGALYVRVDDVVHPVGNLASARLVAGAPEQPARAGAQALAAMRKGPVLGIADAPGVVRSAPDADEKFHACHAEPHVVVVDGAKVLALRPEQAVWARSVETGQEWLITAEGKRLLPDASSVFGRVVQRQLRAAAVVPVWEAPQAVLNTIGELPAFAMPGQHTIFAVDGERFWLDTPDGVVAITPLQAAILRDLGLPTVPKAAYEMAALADAPVPAPVLPTRVPEWVDAQQHVVCANDGEVGVLEDASVVEAALPLAGSGAATHFAGRGAVGVDAGSGIFVVSETGVVHRVGAHGGVDAPAAAAALGLEQFVQSSWPVLSLLPQGSGLSREDALRSHQLQPAAQP